MSLLIFFPSGAAATQANAGLASATAAAIGSGKTVAATAGCATVTAAAPAAVGRPGISVAAGPSQTLAFGYDVIPLIKPAAGLASGTGAANAPPASIGAQGAQSAASAAAHAPSILAPVWTTPADDAPINGTPELKFTMPDLGVAMHFYLQLDTVDTFDSGDLRTYQTSLDQTDWAYWDGDSWEAIPAGGVSNLYAGNEARLTITSPLSEVEWFRRVRAGVA